MMRGLYAKYNVCGDPMNVSGLRRTRGERQESSVELERVERAVQEGEESEEGEEGEEDDYKKASSLLSTMVDCWISSLYTIDVVSVMEERRKNEQMAKTKKEEEETTERRVPRCVAGHPMAPSTPCRMERVPLCDLCRVPDASFTCSLGCNFDLCRKCYSAAADLLVQQPEGFFAAARTQAMRSLYTLNVLHFPMTPVSVDSLFTAYRRY
jgi:hypothetical protein